MEAEIRKCRLFAGTNLDFDTLVIMTSPYPALLMGVACIGGGVTGFLRTGSKPSLIAGVTVGALYLWSGTLALNGDTRGFYGATAASAILFLSSLPRVAKGPVPAALTILSAGAGAYYGQTVRTLPAARP